MPLKKKNELSQELNQNKGIEFKINDNLKRLSRDVGEEGTILLKNDDSVLPIKEKEIVSVFSRCSLDYFYCGYGSGGDVVKPYKINLVDGLRNNFQELNNDLVIEYEKFRNDPKNFIQDKEWGKWPLYYEDLVLTDDFVKEQKAKSDYALYVIGRSAGEDRDCDLIKGSYYLTDTEYNNIKLIRKYFDRFTVVLNIGNIIDMNFIDELNIKGVVLGYQGGMESGNSLARVLLGITSPSGRLTDTIAKEYKDYPSSKDFGNKDFNNYTEDIYVGYRYFNTFKKERILYPFGYGLSYSSFNTVLINSTVNKLKFHFEFLVQNIGEYSSKEVVELYLKLPKGNISKPDYILVGFNKTKELEAGDQEIISIDVNLEDFSSYDDFGYSMNTFSYVLEKGVYEFFLGKSSIDLTSIYKFQYDEDIVVRKTKGLFLLGYDKVFNRMINNNGEIEYEKTPTMENDLRDRILLNIKPKIKENEWNNETLDDVRIGRISLIEFISKLSLDELNTLAHGEGKMNSSLGTLGNAGAFGGVSESLRNKKVPPVITSDGPSGVRVKYTSSLLPIGVLIASTWNKNLIEEIGYNFGLEAKDRKIDMLLAPGMNIHRNPLCGRNFEYYSEDPLLSGTVAGYMIKGIEKSKVSSCPKHYLANNQEYNRCYNDSRISERALREIYLRNFEYMVKIGHPRAIMTSYNMINGIYGHYNFDSCIEFMRKEVGFDGVFITDWWMRYNRSPEFKNVTGNAYRVRSGINVLMPGNEDYKENSKIGNTLLSSLNKKDGIMLSELQENAYYVLKHILESTASLEK